MTILITTYDEKLRREIVSHGVNSETGKVVILPNETPLSLGATKVRGEWVLMDQVKPK